jgi:hypothetical protein
MKAPVTLGVVVAALFCSCGKSPEQEAKHPTALGLSNVVPVNPNPEAPITGAEVWIVSGTNYNIQGTSLLTLGNGQTMFTVKALCEFPPSSNDRPIARSLAKYAIDHGYTAKVKQSSWNGIPQQPSGAIGVSLMQNTPPGYPAPGYRYSFTIAELQNGKSEEANREQTR